MAQEFFSSIILTLQLTQLTWLIILERRVSRIEGYLSLCNGGGEDG